jgi:DNA uptake protein ComE-like DNA-binding protein
MSLPLHEGRARRGLVLLAVLLVIVLASLVGTTVLIVADADRAGAEVSLHRTQSRALAWSGVQAVTAELASQRDGLLEGRPPRVTEAWRVVEDEQGGRVGLYRLVPLGPDGPLVSESGKLDLNSATVEMIALLPGVGADLADAIVAARDRAPLGSVEELLAIEGIGVDALYGAQGGAEAGQDSGVPHAIPLADLVTVFSFDPNVQLGLGQSGPGHRGELRFNINTPWTERLGRAVARRFGQQFADGLQGLMNSGRKFEADRDIVRTLVEFQVPPAEWIESFDAFTTSPDEYLYGRVDLTTAGAEVLACIPGIDQAAAARIVGLRSRLNDESLRTVTWPVAEQALTPEQFEQASDYLTTRSMQWRVRVEAGFEEESGTEDSRMSDRIVLEAVIDVASERPRVAYLRDVTMLETARAVLARSGAGEGVPPANHAADGTVPADEQVSGAEGPSRPARLGRTPARLEAARTQREERFGAGASPASAPMVRDPTGQPPDAGPDRRIGRWNPGDGRQGGRR